MGDLPEWVRRILNAPYWRHPLLCHLPHRDVDYAELGRAIRRYLSQAAD